MFETLAGMSVWKLIVIALAAIPLTILGGILLLGLAAILGPGLAGAIFGGKKRARERAGSFGFLHGIGIAALFVGVGLLIAHWIAGPTPSTMAYAVAVLISGGLGLVAGFRRASAGKGTNDTVSESVERRIEEEIERRMGGDAPADGAATDDTSEPDEESPA